MLLLSALPCVLFNSSRSLMGDQSIWNRTRLDQYFNNRPELRNAFFGAVYFLKSKQCSQIGLDIGTNDWEYPLWPLLNPAANAASRLEHIKVNSANRHMSVRANFIA